MGSLIMLAINHEENSKNNIGRYRILEKSSKNFTSTNEVADYIAQLSGEMAAMARSVNLDVIAYFLEMVREESRKTARNKAINIDSKR